MNIEELKQKLDEGYFQPEAEEVLWRVVELAERWSTYGGERVFLDAVVADIRRALSGETK